MRDIYEDIKSIKKGLKLNNDEIGGLINKSGDAFRKAVGRKSLSDFEIKELLKFLSGMNTEKNPEVLLEIQEALNTIRKKIHKNKQLLRDKILTIEEESNLLDEIKGDPAYFDIFSDEESPIVNLVQEQSDNYNKGVPYYDLDFTASFLEVENNQDVKPDSYISHPFFKGCDYVVRASGQSMAKVIRHGDAIGLIKINDWQEFLPLGEIYAIVTRNGFRMIKVITKSDDPKSFKLISKPSNGKLGEFPEQDIKKESILSIFKVQASSHLF